MEASTRFGFRMLEGAFIGIALTQLLYFLGFLLVDALPLTEAAVPLVKAFGWLRTTLDLALSAGLAVGCLTWCFGARGIAPGALGAFGWGVVCGLTVLRIVLAVFGPPTEAWALVRMAVYHLGFSVGVLSLFVAAWWMVRARDGHVRPVWTLLPLLLAACTILGWGFDAAQFVFQGWGLMFDALTLGMKVAACAGMISFLEYGRLELQRVNGSYA